MKKNSLDNLVKVTKEITQNKQNQNTNEIQMKYKLLRLKEKKFFLFKKFWTTKLLDTNQVPSFGSKTCGKCRI